LQHIRFTLTQAVVWYFNSTVRIDVFGVTDGSAGNVIFDYRWDGQGWNTIPVGRSPSGSTHIQTTSALVFPTSGGGSRLSVYAEDANGAIWEFVSWNGGSWGAPAQMFVGSCF